VGELKKIALSGRNAYNAIGLVQENFKVKYVPIEEEKNIQTLETFLIKKKYPRKFYPRLISPVLSVRSERFKRHSIALRSRNPTDTGLYHLSFTEQERNIPGDIFWIRHVNSCDVAANFDSFPNIALQHTYFTKAL